MESEGQRRGEKLRPAARMCPSAESGGERVYVGE